MSKARESGVIQDRGEMQTEKCKLPLGGTQVDTTFCGPKSTWAVCQKA